MVSQENAVYRVRKLYFEVQDWDRTAPYRVILPDYVTSRQVKACGKWRAFEAACLTGYIAGIAIVWHGDTFTAVGTKTSLNFWEWPYRPFADTTTEAMDCLDEPDTRHLGVLQARRDRIDLLMIQHKVAELFPALRIKRPGGRKPGQPEVLLRRQAGELCLGGIISVASTKPRGV